jgi:hypothetical protein
MTMPASPAFETDHQERDAEAEPELPTEPQALGDPLVHRRPRERSATIA